MEPQMEKVSSRVEGLILALHGPNSLELAGIAISKKFLKFLEVQELFQLTLPAQALIKAIRCKSRLCSELK
jgi:hypothetical protein